MFWPKEKAISLNTLSVCTERRIDFPQKDLFFYLHHLQTIQAFQIYR